MIRILYNPKRHQTVIFSNDLGGPNHRNETLIRSSALPGEYSAEVVWSFGVRVFVGSSHTVDGRNPAPPGINYQPQLVSGISSINSTSSRHWKVFGDAGMGR